MRNTKSIVLLLACSAAAAALDGYLYFGRSDLRASDRPALADVRADVRQVRIERKGAASTVLENADGQWRLTKPFAGSADRQIVMKLLDAILQTPVSDAISDAELLRLGKTAADFALEDPVLSVELVTTAGEVARCSFGAPTPSGDGVYARADGLAAVLVAKTSVFAAVDLPADGFRRRELFSVGVEDVVSFDIKRAGEPLIAFARAETGWRVGDARAASQKVAEFLKGLTSVKAASFVWPIGTSNETDHVSSSLLAGFGLDAESAVAVTLNDANGLGRNILFGKAAGEGLVYALAQKGSAVVTVPAALRDFAVQETVMFTDARFFPVEAREVDGFSIVAEDGLYSLSRRKDGRWGLESPVVAAADSEAVEAVLSRILALTPADVVAAGGVTVTIATNRAPVRVSRERVMGDRTFEQFRSREMLRVDPALVSRLVCSSGGKDAKAVSVVFDRERRQWNLENGEDGSVSVQGVERVLSAVSPLKALRIEKLNVAASDLDDYGLDVPFLTVAIDQKTDEAVRRNVLIGKKAKGGRYATIGSSDAIFVIPDAAVDLLSSSVVDK